MSKAPDQSISARERDAVVKAAIAEQKAYRTWLDNGGSKHAELYAAWTKARKVYTDAVWKLIKGMEGAVKKPMKKAVKKARS